MSKLIKKLNQVGSSTMEFNETRKLKQLDIDNPYKIIEFKPVKTKFGKQIVVTIEIGEKHVDVFLPSRFAKQFNGIIPKLNETRMNLIYQGEFETKNGTTHLVVFEEDENEEDY